MECKELQLNDIDRNSWYYISVADPDGFHPDPDPYPTFEKKPDPDRTWRKNPDPKVKKKTDQTLEKNDNYLLLCPFYKKTNII